MVIPPEAQPDTGGDRYRLAMVVDGADLPESRHERLRWAQEAAAEHRGELAELEGAGPAENLHSTPHPI
ncbi:MAG: hypothetical protein F4Y47_04525 [Acidobacteriia bacterium]|nr:hypothetical protein [Terriglobia bacterium]MYG04274.1 hypothetical protein [Terriglobia bacterium]MYK11421.1 hypothetical protein [Terriglobia bacterium]